MLGKKSILFTMLVCGSVVDIMGKFIKPGKVVIVTKGKHAGTKAFIIKVSL